MSKQEPRYIELIRVSTQRQADAGTPENQRAALDRLAEQRPGERVARIEALGVSGTIPLDQSEEGIQLREWMQRGIDELRIWDIDRCLGARSDDPRERLAVFSMVMDSGAVIVDCAGRVTDPCEGSGIGELDFYLRTFFASRERTKIIARTRAGRQRAAAEGRVSSRPKYGFARNENNHPVINPDTAAVVQRIFELRSQGLAYRKIAMALLADGVVSPGGGKWPDATVLRILTDAAYKGEYRHDGAVMQVDPIVTPTLWQSVQFERRPAGRKRRKSGTIFGGRIFCACGKRCYSTPGGNERDRYYLCASHHSGQKSRGNVPCEHGRRHDVESVDEACWAVVEEAICDPAILQAALDLRDDGSDALAEIQEQLARCEGLLARIVKDEVALGREYRRRLISEAAWTSQLREIAAERRTLEATADLARLQIAQRTTTADSIASAQTSLDELRGRVADASRDERREIVRIVIPDREPFRAIVDGDGKIEVLGAIVAAAVGGLSNKSHGHACSAE